MATHFVEKRQYEVAMVVDTMENEFRRVFAAWPFRFYVVDQGVIQHKAEPDPDTLEYHIEEVGDVVERLLSGR